jgi:hypothetical protein
MPAQTVIQLRNDTAANWTTANPVLALGEIGVENDTRFQKVGDGTTAWTSLAYMGAALTGTAGGDLTGSYPNPTLATSGVTAGAYGSASAVSAVTFDAKGRATSAASTTIAIAPSQVTGTAVITTDTRLSDARTPTAHVHAASDVTSGTLDIARIPTGSTSTTVPLGNHTHTFSSLTSKPTTLSGFGITDAVNNVNGTMLRIGGAEGGQINFQPASTDPIAKVWSVDSYGGSSTPDLRFIEGADTRVTIATGGAATFAGAVTAPNLPAVVETGTVSVTLSSASTWYSGTSAAITLTKAFTGIPRVVANVQGSLPQPAVVIVTAASSTSITLRVFYYASSTSALTIRWAAIQDG